MASTKAKAKAKEVEECFFKNSCIYLEENILKYLKFMDEIQSEVQAEFKKDPNFGFTRLHDMNAYIKVSNLLAEKWSNSNLKDSYQKCTIFYLDKLFPVSKKCKDDKIKSIVANFGRIIAAMAFLNGDDYLGLSCLVSILDLFPLDSLSLVLLMKSSCKLRELKIFKKYDDLLVKYPNCPKELDGLRRACRLYCEFFEADKIEKKCEIIERAINMKNELENISPKTFFNYYCLQILYNLLAVGSKLPRADVSKYGDFLSHCMREDDRTYVIMTSRCGRTFGDAKTELSLYKHDGLPDGTSFLKSISSISDFCDKENYYTLALFDHGCLSEVESKLLQSIFLGIRLGVPFRVIQPLNFFYYLKLRTNNDQDKLKAVGAMMALLLGKMSDFKNHAKPYSRFRQDLLEDSFVFESRSDSQSVLNKTTVSHVPSIPEHLSGCECYLCYEFQTNASLFAEKKYAELLIDFLNIDKCFEFNTSLLSSGYRKIKRRRDVLLKLAFNEESSNNEKQKVIFSIASFICMASANCLLKNKNIGEVSKNKLCEVLINVAAKFPCDLRYYWLLSRQIQRRSYSLALYPWLEKDEVKTTECTQMFQSFNVMDISKNGSFTPPESPPRKFSCPKSPSREALAKRASIIKNQGKMCKENHGKINEMIGNDVDHINEARTDFKNYQHLFYCEWRSRICQYLGAHLSEGFPWYSAWYFIESLSNSLRSSVRLHKQSPMDLRFRDIDSFKAAARSLPDDFTLIQLVIDIQNVLWMVRISPGLEPFVMPLANVDVGRDEISRRMYNVLVENDLSVKPVNSTIEFWNYRKRVDEKLQQLTIDVENKWLSHARALLNPFGVITGTLLKDIEKIENILINAGFSGRKTKLLSRLYLHATEEDYKYMLFVFSIMERDRFPSVMDQSTQNEMYIQIKKACPFKIAYNNYVKQDKYTVLIVSPKLSSYPWESLPVFVPNPFVLRIQSFHFFDRLLKKASTSLPMQATSKNSYFLLNPDRNLARTQTRIQHNVKLEMLQGLIGEHPEKGAANTILENNDFFLYMGHGSGNRYFGSSSIRNTICNSVAILMGCSSVRIEDEGWSFDGRSAVNDYAIAGAPSTIGCLWMVTDGEIDKFLIAFLEHCFTEWMKNVDDPSKYRETTKKSVNYPYRLLIRAVVKAREACKLKALTGGAVVVYGIPVFNDHSVMENFQTSDEVHILN